MAKSGSMGGAVLNEFLGLKIHRGAVSAKTASCSPTQSDIELVAMLGKLPTHRLEHFPCAAFPVPINRLEEVGLPPSREQDGSIVVVPSVFPHHRKGLFEGATGIFVIIPAFLKTGDGKLP